MDSSDEEGEIMPDMVTNYQLVDGRDHPVSFLRLPQHLSSDDTDFTDGLEARIYLHGTSTDGLELIYKQVIAWKYDLSLVEPAIFVLCKSKHWIQLQKPRKCFEFIIRTTLVTVCLLHFLKNNPHAPAKLVWSHLFRAFSSYDAQPSLRDINDHIGLVKDAFKKDLDLSESEYMQELLLERPMKRKAVRKDSLDTKKSSFVVDDYEDIDFDQLEDEKTEEVEGARLPHVSKEQVKVVNVDFPYGSQKEEEEDEDPQEEDEEEEDPLEEEGPGVPELDLLHTSKEIGEAKGTANFDFPVESQRKEEAGKETEGNELVHQHEEAKEDEEEMQQYDTCCAICDNGGDILCCEGPCMRSFHPTEDSGDGLCRSLGLTQAQVDSVPVFFCKNCRYKKHQCSICGKLGSSDNESTPEVFRCVSATCGRFYHAQCVAKALYPGKTAKSGQFETHVAEGYKFVCPAHKCVVCGSGEDRNVPDLQFAICRRCPKSYHRKCLPRYISFEGDFTTPQRAWDDLLPKRILIYCMDHEIIEELGTPARDHIVFPKTFVLGKNNTRRVTAGERTEEKKGKGVGNFTSLEKNLIKKPSKPNDSSGLKATRDTQGVKSADKAIARPGLNYARKVNFVGRPSKILESNEKFQKKEACSSKSIGGKLVIKMKPLGRPTIKEKPVMVKKRAINESEIEKRVNALIEEVNSSFDINNTGNKERTVSNNAAKDLSDKKITMGKVESAVQAVHAALEKLDSGCNIEEALAICPRGMLGQIGRWKRDLGGYIGPFLHGMRYSSFGRHFTKVEKLQEIVDRLHWYVQDGDMIVDFSCGVNDFSCLMSKKLTSAGKECFFKNYDLHQAKRDFNFEKRDWFSVGKGDLPDGSKLIIGLNPPFGKTADEFISHALRFRPKLTILIVPRENQWLGTMKYPYHLIGEDPYLLAGKSFYLPGSIDVHNKQIEQWNIVPPLLCLWSRPDWSQRHREIAMRHNHWPRVQQNVAQPAVSNYLMEEKHDCFGDFSSLRSLYVDLPSMLDDIPEDGGVAQPDVHAQSPVSMEID